VIARRVSLVLASLCLLHVRAAEVLPLLSQSGQSWPTHNGDTSGRRFSDLTQINRSNVGSLTLAWAFQTHVAETLKCTPLLVDGILYFTAPDHVWAIDARTGQQVWHYERPSTGNHIGQRGVAFYNGRVFFGTPDAHLISLDARDGKLIWDMKVADS
jgi:alcohol dehydrogenase (cytochrome c)